MATSTMGTRFFSTALAGLALCAAAPAAAQVFTGDTTGSPTFDRPVHNNDNPPVGTAGGAFPYDVVAFTVTASGSYSLLLETSTVGFDTYLGLYSGSFDPNAPLVNALEYDDDDGAGLNSLIEHSLTSGTSYFAVITGFTPSDFGAYSLTIRGDGEAISSAVPEPATWAMMLVGFGAAGVALRRRKSRQVANAAA